MSMGKMGWWMVAGVVPAIVACASAGGTSALSQLNPQVAGDTMAGETHFVRPVELKVENHDLQDVTLYVEHDGIRSRLALATAAKDAVLYLPTRLIGAMGTIRLIARPIGGGRSGMTEGFASDPITVQPGQKIVWTLESGLQRSSVGVW